MPTPAIKLSVVEDALKFTQHQLDLKRIDIFLLRQEAQDIYTSKMEYVRTRVSCAKKLYWMRRIEQDKALMDEEIERIHKWVEQRIVVLVEKLKEVMKMDGPEAWEREGLKAIADFYDYEP